MIMMIIKMKMIPRWSLIMIVITFNLIMNTNGFNVERSSTRQGKSAKSSSSNGQFSKNGANSNHGSTHWKGKQYMDTNEDHHESTANQQEAKADHLTDAEFQQARVID